MGKDCAICKQFIDLSIIDGHLVVINTRYFNETLEKIHKGSRETICFDCGTKINALITKMKEGETDETNSS